MSEQFMRNLKSNISAMSDAETIAFADEAMESERTVEAIERDRDEQPERFDGMA